ncbi:MAG: Holliday junction resolvase Hjc [Candidatus Hadarchaeia archaeon]
MGKGSRRERELVNLLWESGFAVMRSPASGSGRKHPQPDVLASNGDKEYGIETKSSSSNAIYVKKEEVEKLGEFCDKFGCEPLIGVRFDRQGWLFVKPDQCVETEKSLKITKEATGIVLVKGEGFRKQKRICG